MDRADEMMKPAAASRRAGDVKRYRYGDVDRCIGGRCPCLCHAESLRLAHYNGHLVADADGFAA